jgi:glutamate 5-kinase
MKKISTKPIETLAIEFVDGTVKELKFSAYAMMVLDEEFEGFIAIAKEAKTKPFINGAKLLYVGVKAVDEKFTYNDAKRLVVNMSVEDIAEIFTFATETLGSTDKATEETLGENRPQ